MNPNYGKFEQIVKRIDLSATLLEISGLKNENRSNISVLTVMLPSGREKRVVVRVFGAEKIFPRPYIASNEFMFLQRIKLPNLETPSPIYFDQSKEIFSTPYMVLDYIEGKTELDPSNLPNFIIELVGALTKIHGLRHEEQDIKFLPNLEDWIKKVLTSTPEEIDVSLDEGRIRDALTRFNGIPTRNKPALLHGDFWLGNILWRDEKIVGVIDWENVMLGDPVFDLAISRIDLMMGSLGSDAMCRFTEQYKSKVDADFTYLPYWDLYAALRHASKIHNWAKDKSHEQVMREGHHLFVAKAFEKISELY